MKTNFNSLWVLPFLETSILIELESTFKLSTLMFSLYGTLPLYACICNPMVLWLTSTAVEMFILFFQPTCFKTYIHTRTEISSFFVNQSECQWYFRAFLHSVLGTYICLQLSLLLVLLVYHPHAWREKSNQKQLWISLRMMISVHKQLAFVDYSSTLDSTGSFIWVHKILTC